MKTSRKNKFFCASPAPLLWKGLFFIIPLLFILLIVLVSQTLIKIYFNKKHHKKIFDKSVKILSLWSLTVFFSLITYGIIGLDFNYYLLEFFFLTVFILVAFFIGERYRLFAVSKRSWIVVTFFSLLFAILFVVCFLGQIKSQTAFAQGLDTACINRLLF